MRRSKKPFLTIPVDPSGKYSSADEAILDNGFEYYGDYEGYSPLLGVPIARRVYRRVLGGSLFAIASSALYFHTHKAIMIIELTEEGKKKVVR